MNEGKSAMMEVEAQETITFTENELAALIDQIESVKIADVPHNRIVPLHSAYRKITAKFPIAKKATG